MPDGVTTIRETLFGECIGAKILDITTGEFGEESEQFVYFHLDNGQTFFATIGNEETPGLMGFVDMEAGDDEEDEEEQSK